MNVNRPAISIISMVVVVAAVALFYGTTQSNSVTPSNDLSAVTPPASPLPIAEHRDEMTRHTQADTDERLYELETQVASLTKQISTIQRAARHSDESTTLAQTSSTSKRRSDNPEAARAEIDAANQQAEDMLRRHQEKLELMVADQSSVREGDAAAATQAITNAINGVAEQGTKVVDVVCAAVLCKVQAMHRNAENQQTFFDGLISRLNEANWNPASEMVSQAGDSESALRSTIYLSREGQPLPM